MKKVIALIMAIMMVLFAGISTAENNSETYLRVGNPTPMRGRFFTLIWGGTTSDLDVQHLIHGYSLAKYDIDQTRYRFDTSVVQDAMKWEDEDGDWVYQIILYDDLKYSDGTPITVRDYAFSMLFTMDPVLAETGGTPINYTWMKGAEEYLNGEVKYLSGIQIVNDWIIRVSVKKEALPYFYELSRFCINPYPIHVLAPGISVQDDGEGCYLSEPLTADLIQQTVLDAGTGYLNHPSVTSCAYLLTKYEDNVAKFERNPYYKGNEQGYIPQIDALEYGWTDCGDMVVDFDHDKPYLLNKATRKEAIDAGLALADTGVVATEYPRTGLTMLWFKEESPKVQDLAVRQAIAYCFDRRQFTRAYAGTYGKKVDGFYGIGQWMYLVASRKMNAPVDPELSPEEKEQEEAYYQANDLGPLVQYGKDLRKAQDALDKGGWVKNEQGLCVKDGVVLNLTMGIPESEPVEEYLETYLVSALRELGIEVTFKKLTMEEIQKEYDGKTCETDILYLGEDFNALLNIETLAPLFEMDESVEVNSNLTLVKNEVYETALEMVTRDPEDIKGFYTLWLCLQQRITEGLPLLPVYSNYYYDFYADTLKNYDITDFITWGEAIVEAYLIK